MPGTFVVGGQGESTYSIPIVTPAATGGLKPNLALTYNHLDGNGLAGMRWTLSGVSAITRCGQTFSQDGATVAVNYTATDRFCLDGRRLVAISGAYGANGTEYRTEVETFQRIVQENVVGGGPESFRVDHGNGLRSYFGATAESRVEAVSGGVPGAAVKIWFISYTEDQFGNRINYLYTENTNGEAYPREVNWTQNTNQGLSPRYKAVITSVDRPADDMRSGYDSVGKQWAATKRIQKIEVYYNTSQLINAYDLAYTTPPSAGTGRSQLQSVTVSRSPDNLPATTFTWQNGTKGWGTLTSTGLSAGTNPLIADINGDGRKDIVSIVSGNWHILFGNANGTLTARSTTIAAGPTPWLARVMDYDADGLSDLLFSSGGFWRVLRYEWDGDFFTNVSTGLSSSSPSTPVIRDFDGDGRDDLVYQETNQIKWRRNTGGAFAAAANLLSISSYGIYDSWLLKRAPDYNGDGRDDVVNMSEYCVDEFGLECYALWTVLIASGNSYVAAEVFDGAEGSLYGFAPIDVNGDGLDDLVYNQGATWKTKVSTGNGVFAAAVNTTIPFTSGQVNYVSDFDHDGREDLILTAANEYRIYRSNGSTVISSYESLSSTGALTANAHIADISGEGFEEIVRVSGGVWHTHASLSTLPDVIATFTDGLGYAVNVVHESLSTTSSYTVDLGHVAPPLAAAYRGNRHVVTTETHDTGLPSPNGTRQFTHMYDTAFVDGGGRGWLGFYFHQVNTLRPDDTSKQTYTKTFFKREHPFVGMIDLEELRRSSDNQLIRDIDSQLSTTTLTGGLPARVFARVESTTTREYEVGGIANGQHLRTIVDDPTFDTTAGTYGHMTQRAVTTTDPVTAEAWGSTTVFDPTADTDDWCLGLPGLVETTNTAPGQSPVVRRVRHAWNINDCSLTTLTEESEASPAKQLRTSFTYDGYGNPNVVTQDSADGTATDRSVDYTFDSFGHFPTSLAVGTVNLTTNLTFDYLTGQQATVTPPENLVTSFTYDAFGRLKRETRPGGVYTDFTFTACGSCWPQGAVYYRRAQGSDGSDTSQFFDELQRPVGTSTKLPLGTEGRQEIRYNVAGQVDRQSQAYVYLDPVFWVTYQYDLLGRVLVEDAPVSESTPSGATTSYAYNGHEVAVTDANNHVSKYLHNAARQIKQVTDALNSTTAYSYRPFGELATVTDYFGNVTTVTYDARGNKATLSDPSMGNWAYDTNVFGELAGQRSPLTTAPTWTTTLNYDAGGRLTTRYDTAEAATTTWVYHPTGNGSRGKVDTITGPSHGLKYTYDATHGQPTQIRYTLDGTNYPFDMTYDSQVRLNVLTYPTSTSSYRFKVDYDYDSWGHQTVAKDGNTPSTVYYSLTEADALGREVLVDLGNTLDEYREYDRATQRLKLLQTGPGLTATIQNLSVTYDEVGNVLTRTSALISKTETLVYDALDRLDSSQVTGQTLVDINYDQIGRITSKSDAGGTYTYTGGCGGGPMAVKSANSKAYCYDASGRMTSRGGAGNTITWFSYDLPKKVTFGTQSDEFFYGVDRLRYKQIRRTNTTVNSTLLYMGELLERETAGSTVTWRHYVKARGRTIAQVNRVNTTNTIQYLHRDTQGSVVEVTSNTGSLVQSLAYDPWGLRRNPANWAPLASPFGGTQPTKRGYTGHEHLDNVELIHMNGRAQDPKIGVFISADPFIQAPYDSRSLNRYSYVWNNPVTFVDPSGFAKRDNDKCKSVVHTCGGGGGNLGPGHVEEDTREFDGTPEFSGPLSQFTDNDRRDLSSARMPMPQGGHGVFQLAPPTTRSDSNTPASPLDPLPTSIQVRYGPGLERLTEAVNQYGVLGLFSDILPSRTTIEVRLAELEADVAMSAPSKDTVLVNGDFLGRAPLNVVASSFGHELIHIDDHLRGNLNSRDRKSVARSENRAYQWNLSTANHFNLDLNTKAFFRSRAIACRPSGDIDACFH